MNMSDIFFLRPARPDDFPFAEAIYIEAMRPLMEQLGCWDEPMRRAAIRRSFKTADSWIIIAHSTEIGWMQVTERDADYNLAQLQILERYCGNGIGSKIIEDLMAKAKHAGKSVSLSAVRTNRAIQLYRRMGFKFIDEHASPILDMVWEP